MQPTVKLKLRKDKKNAKGLCPIFIESYHKGARVNKSSKIFIDEEMWDDKAFVIKKEHPQSGKLNRDLRAKVAELEAGYSKQAEHGEVQLKVVTKDSQLTFPDYAKKVIERQKGKLDEKTIEKYLCKIEIIRGFDKHTKIGKINYDWLERLEQWLRKERGGNTVWDYFKLVRKVCINAAKKNLLHKNPFEEYPMPEYQDPEITYLVKEDLDKIKTYIEEAKTVDASYIIAVYFLLECYSGLRHSDWSRFKVETLLDGEAVKVSAKKNGEPVYLYLEDSPMLKWVVDKIKEKSLKYDFTLETTNAELKYLARTWEIDKRISSHVARHSFGVMCAELGISKETTAECMGITTKVCDVYFKVTRQKVRNEFKAWKNFQ